MRCMSENYAIIIGSDNGFSPERRQTIIWMLQVVKWTLSNKLQWNLTQDTDYFHWSKCIWKCGLQTGGHSVSASTCQIIVIYSYDSFITSLWVLILYKKMSYHQYRKSHCGDKTVLRSSCPHAENSYTGKTASDHNAVYLYGPRWRHEIIGSSLPSNV